MSKKQFTLIAGIGCLAVIVIAVLVMIPLLIFPLRWDGVSEGERTAPTPVPGIGATQEVVPTLSPPPGEIEVPSALPETDYVAMYDALNPGVVNIQVFVERGGMTGQGAGSGFVLNQEGYIVTNNHVIADAFRVTVIFFNGMEVEAEIVGTDDDSDLAVIQVDELPTEVRPLPLGDSDQVEVGERVIAIGNPFGLGSSMSVGIVSAVGRMIPSGSTPFNIPQAIQTDAAINPGNSGGPLLDLEGSVIGVNAQIASSGSGVNVGVGFAIPSNVVRRVVPVLIEHGRYRWPWLGVEGTSVNLVIMEANDLPVQQGAYIANVVSGGPAAEAGLQGNQGERTIEGDVTVPVGGDVIVGVNGNPVVDFSDLLTQIAFKEPGDVVTLTVLRDGEREQIAVELEARPPNLGS